MRIKYSTVNISFFLSMEIFYFAVFITFLGFFSFLSLAPFVPTKNKDLERVAKIAGLKKWETFLEIGCGTAKVSIFLAQYYPENTIIWIEFSPFLYLYSKIKSYFYHLPNLKIVYGNALNLDFSQYDVFYLFGTPDSLKEKIIPKFKTQAKQKARLLSYCFCLENSWLIEKKYKESEMDLSVYEYSTNFTLSPEDIQTSNQ